MSEAAQSSREPFRVPDDDLDDLACTLAKVTAEVQQHGAILDRLTAETTATPAQQAASEADPSRPHAAVGSGDESTPMSILAMDGEATPRSWPHSATGSSISSFPCTGRRSAPHAPGVTGGRSTPKPSRACTRSGSRGSC